MGGCAGWAGVRAGLQPLFGYKLVAIGLLSEGAFHTGPRKQPVGLTSARGSTTPLNSTLTTERSSGGAQVGASAKAKAAQHPSTQL